MDIKRASQVNLILGLIGLGILVFEFMGKGKLSISSLIMFLIIFALTLIIEKKYFKCPHCKKQIKRDDFFRKTCRNCGKNIAQEKT